MTNPTPIVLENSPTLYTDRLILRAFTEADAEDLLPLLADKEVNTFLPWFPLETVEQARQHLEQHFLRYYRLPYSYRYAICLKSDARVIGYVNVGDAPANDFGYGLQKVFWHKGIATEAAAAVVARLRAAGFPYITATHDVNNPHSGEVMKKLGMTYRYSYVEQCQPKDVLVTFRMYQLNFDGSDRVYQAYWNQYPEHFVETGV